MSNRDRTGNVVPGPSTIFGPARSRSASLGRHEDCSHALASKHRRTLIPALRQRDAQRNSRLPRARGPCRARKEKGGKGGNAGATPAHTAITVYEEWPLPNAVLKCVQDNSTATFQLQFTWATARKGHDSQVQPACKRRQLSKKTQHGPETREERPRMRTDSTFKRSAWSEEHARVASVGKPAGRLWGAGEPSDVVARLGEPGISTAWRIGCIHDAEPL